jgi:hypothetical protein
MVRVNTPSPRLTTDIGDHSVSLVVTPDGDSPVRFSSSLADLKVFNSVPALMTDTEKMAYVKQDSTYTLYLRLDRNVGQELYAVLDITDPLGRGAHATLTVPAVEPAAPPKLTKVIVNRQGGAVFVSFLGNPPQPPDHADPWTLTIGLQRVFPPGPVQTLNFDVATVKSLALPASMPTPTSSPLQSLIAQVGGTDPRQFLFWVKSAFALKVAVQLKNSHGQTATVQGISP